ncbi:MULTISPECIES: DUF5994 family protein [Streptomyces]|uniref:Uncharacterized protein n=1 Tax=Streptomyces xanthochromogenes TaxID=67384 RepID=A0ABQ3AU86_9ACTN|nr:MULTISPECIES: DUF5994 family protein [Streptomyces]MYV94787.1 hypothetical protein [Streptomyces sp. SID1034]GGY66954.1 hypothetical protein GCM10010326_71840 [Streptomyces xanthochromogenes]
MSATTIDRRPSPDELSGDPAARIALRPVGSSPGLLDGAWWPRSRDLLRELPALIDALAPRWGRITRIAVNPRHWPVVPRKIPVRGHVVKAGWFKDEQDPHKLLLLSCTAGRWDLLVVPPETGAAAAARLMAAATDDTGPQLTATALMAAEAVVRDTPTPHGTVPDPHDTLESPRDTVPHDTSAADRLQDREEAWEYEGGASSTYGAVGTARPNRTLMGM